MKIEYRTPPGGGSYLTLADESTGSLAERITGYQVAMKKSPMVEALFQSATPFVQDIGNTKWTIRFGVDRIHASADAALAFVATHAALFNTVASLDLQITVGASVLHALNCAVTEMTPTPHSDLSTFISYGFSGPSYS